MASWLLARFDIVFVVISRLNSWVGKIRVPPTESWNKTVLAWKAISHCDTRRAVSHSAQLFDSARINGNAVSHEELEESARARVCCAMQNASAAGVG
jgi:hypothetical protein